MSTLLDGLMILLFVLCVISGWKRGFIKVASGLIALVTATVVSSLLTPAVKPVIARYATELAPPLLDLLCSMALFLAVYVVALLLLAWLDFIAKLPLLRQVNQLLGLVAGVLSGVLWVLFAMGVVTALVLLEWIPSLTPAVLEETQLFSWINTTASSLL